MQFITTQTADKIMSLLRCVCVCVWHFLILLISVVLITAKTNLSSCEWSPLSSDETLSVGVVSSGPTPPSLQGIRGFLELWHTTFTHIRTRLSTWVWEETLVMLIIPCKRKKKKRILYDIRYHVIHVIHKCIIVRFSVKKCRFQVRFKWILRTSTLTWHNLCIIL